MMRLVAAVGALALLGGCASGHHEDPMLLPSGSTGAAALGQPVAGLDPLVEWVQRVTDECDDAEPASEQELAEYLGPTRFPWYAAYVGEWATCAVRPYAKIGLVVFTSEGQTAFQESWAAALRSGEARSNPDWAFGNGFAVTAGPLGVERLGLRYLVCEPGDIPATGAIPSDVEGCVFVDPEEHHG